MAAKIKKRKQNLVSQAKRLHLSALRRVTGNSWIELASELNPAAAVPVGFENCIIGIATRFGQDPILALDYDKCIEQLMQEGMNREDALEHFEYNVIGAWVGEGTPTFIRTEL